MRHGVVVVCLAAGDDPLGKLILSILLGYLHGRLLSLHQDIAMAPRLHLREVGAQSVRVLEHCDLVGHPELANFGMGKMRFAYWNRVPVVDEPLV